METQAISAPADKLTREAPKHRQVGYGLPCAKCHKYFPADLEVCPICKGRERVSPVIAPKIRKPVQSETSVALSSSNIAVKLEGKESPKSESPALAPPIEIKVKDQPLDHTESIIMQAAEPQAAVKPAPASLVPTQEVKESRESESPTSAQPIAMRVNDQPLERKESITTPAVDELAAIERAPAGLVTAQTDKRSRKLESLAFAPPVEMKVNNQPLERKETVPTPTVAEPPTAVEPARASLVPAQTDKESPKSEPAASALPVEIKVNDQPLDHKESIPTPVVAEIPAAAEPARTSVASTHEEKTSPKLDAPASAPPIEIKVKAQPLDQKESITVLVAAELPAAVEPARAGLVSTQKAKEPPKSESPAITCLSDQPIQEEPISTPALVEARACEPAPTKVAPTPEEKNRATELEPPAAVDPRQIVVEDQRLEDQRRHKINEALRIVIPMLVEAQASKPAAVATEQKLPEQEHKAEVAEIVEPLISASQSKTMDKGSNAPPKHANVSSPVVVHVNLGELRAPKSTPECAPAPAQFKEIEPTESEAGTAYISPDAYASEPPAPVSGRRFDLVTFALGVVVLACAVLLITLVALRLMPRHSSAEPVRRAKPAYSSAPATSNQNPNASIPTAPPTAAASGNSVSSDSSPVVAPTAAPTQSPTASASNLSSSPGSERVLALSPGLAEGNLLYRVEPDYPEEARRHGVQGPVVLDLHISKDGLVQGVDLVSGQPPLVQAATAAVKQWRFRTRYVNGNEVEMQARITLHFALPTP
jgi:TonB family protein